MRKEMHIVIRATLVILLSGLVKSRNTVSDVEALPLVRGSRQLQQSSWNFCNPSAGQDGRTAYDIAWKCRTCQYKAPIIVNDQRECRLKCLSDAGCKCAIYKSTVSVHGGHHCQMMNQDCGSAALGLWRPQKPTDYNAVAPCRYEGGAGNVGVTPPHPRCNSRPEGYTGPENGANVGTIYSFPQGGHISECVCEDGWNGVPAWSCTSVDPYHNLAVDYGWDKFQASGVDMFITLAPNANGARVKYTWASKSAWYCADVQTPPGVSPGAIFSLYASSGEPWNRDTEKWDELDFEFLLNTPQKMWLNTWKDGKVIPGQEGYKALWFAANDGFHRYCLDWDLNSQVAKWTVDGQLYRQYTMQGWSKPLIPYISFWGQSGEWAGWSNFSNSLTVHIRNVTYKIRG